MGDGKEVSSLCVATPHKDPSIIFPITNDGIVLLVRQFRFAVNAWVYELPGGVPKLGQTWREVAQEELLEEVGAVAEAMRIIGNPLPFNPALQDARAIAILATGCRVVRPQTLGESETMDVQKVTIAQFRANLKSGKYCDSKTVAIGYLALDHLGLL